MTLGRACRLMALAAASLLGACSMGTRLAYDHADQLLLLQLRDYVELDDGQRVAVKRELKTVHDWHRRTQLPAYALTLRTTAATLDRGPPPAAAVDALLDELENHGKSFGTALSPPLVRLLPTLSDPQVAGIVKEQRRVVKKNLDKHADETPDERQERLAEEAADKLDDWLGRVLPAQRAIIERRFAEVEALGLLDPAHERREQEADLQLIAELLNGRRQPGLATRLDQLGEPATDQERAEVAASRDRGRRYVVALAATLDERQRRHLAKRLRRFAEDCEVLAAEPLDPP